MKAGDHKRSCGAGAVALSKGLVGLVVCATLMGCAVQPKKKQPPVDYARRIHKLEKQLRAKSRQIEDLKERNLVLEHRGASQPKAFDPAKPAAVMYTESSPPPPEPTPKPKSETDAKEDAIPDIAIPEGENAEHFLYSKIIDTYRAHDMEQMKTTLRLLLRTYPDSIFADNALFMAGMLAFEGGDLKGAREFFERVTKEFPRGNKVVSALFMTAAIDKKSGKSAAAVRGFKLVRDLFPGSPEAFRVSVELKLLGPTTTKVRET